MFSNLHEGGALRAGLIVAVIGLGLLGFRTYELGHQLSVSEQTLASTTQTFTVQVLALKQEKQSLQDENDALSDELRREKRKNSDLEEQIGDISQTVDELEKLRRLDPELLQKYSKVFFLNEHYTPSKLSDIPKKYLYSEAKEQQIHRQVLPFLTDMFEEAKDDDIMLYVVSGYRSFGTQATLKGQYTVTYGSGANQFSADQGYSEHQLGTTVDLTTTGINGGLNDFENTPAYAWLEKNAYKYGFVLSYPENNAYYEFEPWHWRFVGVRLARKLYRSKMHFYDMDQREINTYLGEIFD